MTVARLRLVGRTENQLQPAVSISVTHVPQLPQPAAWRHSGADGGVPKRRYGSLQKWHRECEGTGPQFKRTALCCGPLRYAPDPISAARPGGGADRGREA